MITATTAAPEGTRSLAAVLAGLVRGGDLLLLVGDLGAGKTAFAQGFGGALGVDGPITSPTFTLHNRYEGRLTFHHLDVYRLDDVEEAAELGLAELLEPQAVTLIEWGSKIVPVLPANYLEVALTFGDGPDDRMLTIQCVGDQWAARADAVCAALAPWVEETPC